MACRARRHGSLWTHLAVVLALLPPAAHGQGGPPPPRRGDKNPAMMQDLERMHDLYCKELGHMESAAVCSIFYARRGGGKEGLRMPRQPPQLAEVAEMHEAFCQGDNVEALPCRKWAEKKKRFKSAQMLS